jgi:hypothetical protein
MLVLVLAAVGAASAQKNFYDKDNKVGFKYPSTWKVATPDKAAAGGAPGDMKEVAEVSMPDKLYPGTNFEGGKATVSALPAPAGGCSAILADGYEKPVKWRKVTVGGKSFDRFDDGDGATGHYYTRHTFRTLHGGSCYEVVLEVATTNVGMLPHKVKHLNIDTVLASMETIVRSLYF